MAISQLFSIVASFTARAMWSGPEHPHMHILHAPPLPLWKIASFTAFLLVCLAGAVIVSTIDRVTRPSAAEAAGGDWVLMQRWTDNAGIEHQERKIFADNRAPCLEAAIIARGRGSAARCPRRERSN
jgi:hypothetical protein